MIIHPHCLRISGMTSCIVCITANTFNSIICLYSDILVCSTEECNHCPALLKRMSIRPYFSIVLWIKCLISSSLVRSVSTTKTSFISFAMCSSLSCERAAKTTLAQYWDNNLAVASPIPDEAPVTMTTLSLIFMIP